MTITFQNPQKFGQPRQPENRYNPQPMVRLYFVGVNLLTPIVDDPETNNVIGYVYPTFALQGRRAVTAPPVGDYIELPENQAKILEDQSRVPTRDGQMLVSFTRDARYADAVKRSFNSGKSVEEVQAADSVHHLSDEELLKEMEKRFGKTFLKTEDEKPAEIEEKGESSGNDQPPADEKPEGKKSVGRPKGSS